MAPSVNSTSTAGPEIFVTRPIFSGINSSSQCFGSQLSALSIGVWRLEFGPSSVLDAQGTSSRQMSIVKCCLLRCCSTHNFNNLLGDLCLAHPVHGQGEGVDHVASVVCRRVHGSHPSSVFRSCRFLQTAIDLNGYIFWQKRLEQLLWRLLVDVIDRSCGKFGCRDIDVACVCGTNTN